MDLRYSLALTVALTTAGALTLSTHAAAQGPPAPAPTATDTVTVPPPPPPPPPSTAPAPPGPAPYGEQPHGAPPPHGTPPPYGEPPPYGAPPPYGPDPSGYGPRPKGPYRGSRAYPPPDYRYPDRYPKMRRRTELLVPGIVMSATGGITAFTGLILLAASVQTSVYGVSGTNTDLRTAGLVTLIAGTVVAVGGIPLIVIGARKVPVEDDEPMETSALPALSVGPTGANMSWQF